MPCEPPLEPLHLGPNCLRVGLAAQELSWMEIRLHEKKLVSGKAAGIQQPWPVLLIVPRNNQFNESLFLRQNSHGKSRPAVDESVSQEGQLRRRLGGGC